MAAVAKENCVWGNVKATYLSLLDRYRILPISLPVLNFNKSKNCTIATSSLKAFATCQQYFRFEKKTKSI